MLPAARRNFSHRAINPTRTIKPGLATRCDPSPRKARHGDAPSVAPQTISDEAQGAMKKSHSHSSRRRFSNNCCVKNTQILQALTRATAKPEFSIIFNMLHEISAIADDLFDNGIHRLRTPLPDKMIEFWRLFSLDPTEKLILEAFGSNGCSLPSAGCTRIAVRQNRPDSHSCNQNRITFAKPANHRSASDLRTHPQKNLREVLFVWPPPRARTPTYPLKFTDKRIRI